MRLQLNVNNLLVNDDPYCSGIRMLAGRNYRDAFHSFGPRKFILSATVGL